MPDDLLNGLEQILYSGQLAYGNFTRKFEDSLRKMTGNQRILSICNNNLTMQIALDLLDITSGYEVISSPMSCLASNQPILTNKLKVVWADIDPNTGTLDPEDVKKKITAKTKAIIHYHWCGYPGYIDEINSLAQANGIFVLEDGAEAFGAEYNGLKIGNNGSDIVCFSFGPVRLPTTIEGGALAFGSEYLYNKALLMRDYGIDRSYFRNEMGEININCDIELRGYGALMNDLNGYIGYKQLCDFSELIKKQRIIADFYDKALKFNSKFVKLKTFHNNPSYWVYIILASAKNKLLNYLKKCNIGVSGVHLRNDLYSCFGKCQGSDLKGVAEFESKHLAIPSGWWINESERAFIANSINDFLSVN